MINIDSHSFNNSVLEQIDKIKTALTKITPDNVKYFDNNLLRKARGVVNSADEYKWSKNGNINSVNSGYIKALTDKLKISSVEYIVIENSRLRLLSDFGEDDSVKRITFSYKYDIPDKFDGRNSFVKHVLVTNVNASDTANPQHRNDLVYIANSTTASYSVNRSATNIFVEGSIPKETVYGTGELRYVDFGIYLVIVLWRKK